MHDETIPLLGSFNDREPLSFGQHKNAFVQIKGTTNINTFKCINDKIPQSIAIDPEAAHKNTASETTIHVMVNDFDCKNKVMNHDFKNTLHAEKYPQLTIVFVDWDKITANKYKACIEVKMMNKLKKYQVDFTLSEHQLVGNKLLHFSDFDIAPPQKFGGMVYVKDQLDLFFSLNTKE